MIGRVARHVARGTWHVACSLNPPLLNPAVHVWVSTGCARSVIRAGPTWPCQCARTLVTLLNIPYRIMYRKQMGHCNVG